MTLKMIRTNEIDPFTIESVRLGIAPVRYLQQNPDVGKYMKETSKLALPNIKSEEPAYFRIHSENMGFDLHWIHLFDYILDGANLHREARADWGYLP